MTPGHTIELAEGRLIASAEDAVGWITFNQPERLNAVRLDMWRALPQAVAFLEQRSPVRAIIIRGAGERAFISGADIAEFDALRCDAATNSLFTAAVSGATGALAASRLPIIAMINGFCIGGGIVIASACDIRICSAGSRFGVPAGRLGLGYELDNFRRLFALVGATATEMLLTARHFSDEEMKAAGFINRIAPAADLPTLVREYADMCARNAPLSLAAAKASARFAMGMAGEALAQAQIDACFDSADYKEGRRAFHEKREPRFEGNCTARCSVEDTAPLRIRHMTTPAPSNPSAPAPTAGELLERPFATISDLLGAHAREAPDHIALIEVETSISYGALDALLDRAAAAMQRDGVHSGDAIAICAPTSIPYVATFMAALRIGAVACPLAPSATAEALAGMVRDCGARLLFVDDDAFNALAGANPPIAARQISLDGAQAESFEAWLAPPGAKPAPVGIDPKAPFNIIYSSGTTGAPKGIVQSHQMRWGHVRRGERMGYGRDAVTIISTPLYSNTTLVSLIPTLARGGTSVLMRKSDTRTFLELSERHRATHAMLVPVQYRRFMDFPYFDRFDLSSFRMKTCTSAPFAADLKAEVLRRWPGGLIEIFGMTEGGGSCLLVAHEHPDKLHTVGQPAEGHDIRIIDEAGRELPRGETGEIVGRSPAMMNGYHNLPAKTAEAQWTSPEGLTFIRTGDVGRFDADGFLILSDRKKDMIISGGFNIYPSDLETVLRGHEAVRECAVVGAPSREWGETPAAFVVLKEGAGIEAEALRAWVNERLGRTQRIAFLSFVETLPRSSIGKVLKRDLRDSFKAPPTPS